MKDITIVIIVGIFSFFLFCYLSLFLLCFSCAKGMWITCMFSFFVSFVMWGFSMACNSFEISQDRVCGGGVY